MTRWRWLPIGGTIATLTVLAACQYVSGLEPFGARPLPPEGGVTLYPFDEGDGSIVHDRQGSLDLTLVDPSAQATWVDGGLRVPLGVYLRSAPAQSLVDTCNAANAFTVVAWVRPTRVDLGGPARLIGLAEGDASSFVLGVEKATYAARIGNEVISGGTVTAGALTHIVLSRDPGGTTRLVVDKAEVARIGDGGTLAWQSAPLSLSADTSGATPWEGELHRVAIHCRPFSDADVQADYAAGP